jgi:DNA-binding PadR family transcriptional regulator
MTDNLDQLGRFSGPATLILTSLAGGERHGYALMQDIEAFAGVTLRPGTLYGALSRLESMGLIEALEASGRRRPYRLTSAGATVLEAHLATQQRVVETGARRLTAAGAAA